MCDSSPYGLSLAFTQMGTPPLLRWAGLTPRLQRACVVRVSHTPTGQVKPMHSLLQTEAKGSHCRLRLGPLYWPKLPQRGQGEPPKQSRKQLPETAPSKGLRWGPGEAAAWYLGLTRKRRAGEPGRPGPHFLVTQVTPLAGSITQTLKRSKRPGAGGRCCFMEGGGLTWCWGKAEKPHPSLPGHPQGHPRPWLLKQ